MKLTLLVAAMLAMSIFEFSLAESQPTYEYYTVKLYEHEDWDGQYFPFHLKGDNCYNLPSNWVNRVSSVGVRHKGKETCIIVFDGRNCEGRGLRIETQEDLGADALNVLDMNDRVSSLRLC